MTRIYLALGGAISILILCGVMWSMGKQLRMAQSEIGKLNENVKVCTAQRDEAVTITREWANKYNTDMKAKDDEAAKLYTDQRARTKATCAASFDAGYKYGVSIRAAQPDGMREQDGDFRSAWIGSTATQ